MTQLVAPTFSSERMLGTNLCVMLSRQENTHLLWLYATSAAATQTGNCPAHGQASPGSWIQDAKGNYTSDPHALKKGGALVP